MRVILFSSLGKIVKDYHEEGKLADVVQIFDPVPQPFGILKAIHGLPDDEVWPVKTFRFRYLGKKAAYYTEVL